MMMTLTMMTTMTTMTIIPVRAMTTLKMEETAQRILAKVELM